MLLQFFQLIICVSLIYFTTEGYAQGSSEKYAIGFNAGYFKTVPGERFISTGDGWSVNIYGDYQVGPKTWVGLDFLWGATPSVDALEYEIFEPRDHDIWFETSQISLTCTRYFVVEQRFQPYLRGRVGRATEFSEYSGPTVNRSGLLVGLDGGFDLRLIKFLKLNMAIGLTQAFLGDATVFESEVQNSSVGASFFHTKTGFKIIF